LNPLNVLSLFDGISCGQLALSRLGIPVANYYASEIDQNAIKVTQHHFPNTIQLGDVKTFNVGALPKIDLMLGGFPCVEFSVAGNRKGLQGEIGSLLYDLVRVKNQVNPTYFLFECTYIPKKDLATINSLIGAEPINLNSGLVSAQNRRRMYWTNIPQGVIQDRGILFNQYLFTNPHGGTKAEIKLWVKSPTIMTGNPRTKYKIVPKGTQVPELYLSGDRTKGGARNSWHSKYPSFSPELCECLQTMPEGYTDVGINKTARYKAVGNGWTVDLIVELLRGIASGK